MCPVLCILCCCTREEWELFKDCFLCNRQVYSSLLLLFLCVFVLTFVCQSSALEVLFFLSFFGKAFGGALS